MVYKFEKGISVLEKILEEEKYSSLTKKVLEKNLHEAIFDEIDKFKDEDQTETSTINAIMAILDNYVDKIE